MYRKIKMIVGIFTGNFFPILVLQIYIGIINDKYALQIYVGIINDKYALLQCKNYELLLSMQNNYL